MKPIPHDNSGEIYLVDQCQQIRIDDVVRQVKKDMKQILIEAQIEACTFKVQLITKRLHHGGIRFWFICPLCSSMVGVIYRHPLQIEQIGCRKCLDLEYRSRRYKGMIEAV